MKLSRAAPSTGPRATRLSVARGEENTRGAFYQLGNWEQIGIKLCQGKKSTLTDLFCLEGGL